MSQGTLPVSLSRKRGREWADRALRARWITHLRAFA